MRTDENSQCGEQEIRIEGLLSADGVKVHHKGGIDDLSSRGYGIVEDGELLLSFCEALYLLDKGSIEVSDAGGEPVDSQGVLQAFRRVDGNAWAKYLTYRDLRSRGYVVRGGFGLEIDFRVYDRGGYGEESARFLILSMQEGKPISVEILGSVLRQCQSLKKELVLAVMNRRGEVVYYSVSQFNLK